MKTVEFRPLRRIKKTGKICVASYTQWNKVKTANYNKFNLVVIDDYKNMAQDEFVHNHKGELLYFFNYNPANIPIYNSATMNLAKLHRSGEPYGICWSNSNHVNYNYRGMDCSGTPTFSHWTEDMITQDNIWNYYGHDQFEPLTVGTVVKWIGWFMWQLENSYLTHKNSK